MSAPVPSKLVLLSHLEQCAPGMKVRFLGCIDEYVVKTATLRLKHDHPASKPGNVVNVDIEHVLEKLKHDAVEVGAWINVIGYVERRRDKRVFVQAIAVWDAGNVDLGAYAEAVEKRGAVG